MPQLSVLMPVYNAEQFLAEAIESVLQQTFTDFEFIIIDDDSSDRSSVIINSYHDPRIRYFKNEKNLGISPTLNKGIELANTNYIARMDADDICYPDRFEKQFAYMQAHTDCAMVSSLVKVIAEDGSFIRQDNFESAYFYYNLTFVCWIYHPSVLYRKDAVEVVNMYTAAYSEDYELFWQISRNYKIYNLPEVLLDYRITNQSLHQVLRKEEYREAQTAQLIRNFRYYAGEKFTIPETYIECLQHNFEPLLAERSVGKVLDCISKLDLLSEKIIAKDNINNDVVATSEAAKFKRRFILNYFARNLPRFQGLLLLLGAGDIKLLWDIPSSHVTRKIGDTTARRETAITNKL